MTHKNIDKILAARAREQANIKNLKGPLKALTTGLDVSKYAPPDVHVAREGVPVVLKDEDDATKHPRLDIPVKKQELCFCTTSQYRILSRQKLDNDAYNEEFDNDQAQESITQLLSSINYDSDCIQALVASHGDRIAHTWSSKTYEERVLFLRNVRPNLEEESWPQFSLYYDDTDWVKKRTHRSTWLAPYLNLASLATSPRTLLQLIHVRSVYTPECFQELDEDMSLFAEKKGLLASRFNDMGVIMSGDKIGALKALDVESCHIWHKVSFPMAERTFMAQEEIYRFLRSVLEASAKCEPVTGKWDWEKLASTDFADAGDTALLETPKTWHLKLRVRVDPLLWTIASSCHQISEKNKLYNSDTNAYALHEQQRVEASYTGLSDGLHDLIALEVIFKKLSSCRPLPLIIPFRYLTKVEQTILKEAQVVSANEADIAGRYHFSEEESDKLPPGATIISKDESYDRLAITDSKLVKWASRLQTLCEKAPWPRGAVSKEKRLKAQSVAHRALIEFWKLLRQTRLDQLRSNNKAKKEELRVTDEVISNCLEIRLLSKFKSDSDVDQIQDEIRNLSKEQAKEFQRIRKRAEAAARSETSPSPATGVISKGPTSPRVDKKKRQKKKKKPSTKEREHEIRALCELLIPNYFDVEEEDTDAQDEDDIEETQEKLLSPGDRIPINRASLNVFGRIFGRNESAFRWQDFAAAMHDAGYRVVSVTGSHSKFVKADGKGKGRIVIPKPHNKASAMESWQVTPIRKRLMVDAQLRYQSFELRSKKGKT